MTNKLFLITLLATTALSLAKTYADFGTCGDDCNWSFNETTKTLTITGSGEMKDYGPKGDVIMGNVDIQAQLNIRPWNDIASEVENVVVSGLNSVGARAFQRMENLKNITISDSVTAVYRAFAAYDDGLTSITLPNSITTIGDHAFTCLFHLENINIPDSVTSIGAKAFYASRNLENLVIPDGVTSIGDGAFNESSAVIYCTATSPCAGKGSENIVPYQREGGVYVLDGKYYLTATDMASSTNECTKILNECKRDVLEAKGICQGSSCDNFIQSDGQYMLKFGGKTYQNINALLRGDYDRRRIYTIEEANFVAGDKNRVSITYR